MAAPPRTIDVYLEVGTKRTFAGAIEWPGWNRAGRDPEAALQALVDSGPRYARVVRDTGLAFSAPPEVADLRVVERVTGNATTDFGAPDVAPESDTRPVEEAELERFQTLLRAYWRAFDEARSAAAGRELRKGPRGGGRDVESIARHVLGAERGYLARIAWKSKARDDEDLEAALARTRQEVLEALAIACRGELPARGPRGGVIWSPRYFVRRLGWHVLDHLWEIEDRVI
ncbi:MAG: hypothetical protein DIU80_014380 [Chloroflexota bacterium]